MIDWLLVLKVLQLVLSVLLIIAVMLHSAKGEGIGAIGGQAKIFGSQKGVEAGLNRFATIISLSWAGLSILLAFISYHK